MKTIFMHAQHERCLKALELISTCDEYINNCRQNLKRHISLPWYKQMPGVTEYNEKNIKKYILIKERLKLYYANQFMKMIDPVAAAIEE